MFHCIQYFKTYEARIGPISADEHSAVQFRESVSVGAIHVRDHGRQHACWRFLFSSCSKWRKECRCGSSLAVRSIRIRKQTAGPPCNSPRHFRPAEFWGYDSLRSRAVEPKSDMLTVDMCLIVPLVAASALDCSAKELMGINQWQCYEVIEKWNRYILLQW